MQVNRYSLFILEMQADACNGSGQKSEEGFKPPTWPAEFRGLGKRKCGQAQTWPDHRGRGGEGGGESYPLQRLHDCFWAHSSAAQPWRGTLPSPPPPAITMGADSVRC